MSELRDNLRNEFHDKEYRHVYADESLNTYIATQIKVLREQRELTQKQLAEETGMAQPRIAVLEDVNYCAWSISTLRRLAQAFDLRLSVRFENFSSLIPEIDGFNRDSLKRDSFKDDSWFHKKSVEAADSPIARAAFPAEVQGAMSGLQPTNKIVSIASYFSAPTKKNIGAAAALAGGK